MTSIKKLRIETKVINEKETRLGKEVKQSVIKGQLAYKNGGAVQFTKIVPKDLWR